MASAIGAARSRPWIAVIGSGRGARDVDIAVSERVGRAVAEAGAVLVCGGLGGVMEAACRGAAEAGGLTVGILPGTDRADANPDVDVAIATGLGEIRNAVIVHNADAVVAVGGEFGTLSEIALALRADIPVVGIDTWHLDRDTGDPPDPIVRMEDPDGAVREALRLAAVHGSGG